MGTPPTDFIEVHPFCVLLCSGGGRYRVGFAGAFDRSQSDKSVVEEFEGGRGGETKLNRTRREGVILKQVDDIIY